MSETAGITSTIRLLRPWCVVMWLQPTNMSGVLPGQMLQAHDDTNSSVHEVRMGVNTSAHEAGSAAQAVSSAWFCSMLCTS
jgi:hypothetical protein